MEDHENIPVAAPKKKSATKKAQISAQKGDGSSAGASGATGNHTHVLRAINTNAAGASSSPSPSSHAEPKRTPAPSTKESSKIARLAAAPDKAEQNKENDAVKPKAIEGETNSRRVGKAKAKGSSTSIPDAVARTAPAETGRPAPYNNLKPEVGKVHQDTVSPVKKEADIAPKSTSMRDDGDAGSETEKTVVADTESRVDSSETNHDSGQDKHMDESTATGAQDDLFGLPLSQSTDSKAGQLSRSNPQAPEKTTSGEKDEDRFPGWDDYPALSADDNDRESRARGSNYYRAYGVQFAPFKIPWRRRLQTLAVVMHSLSILSTVSFFFFLCAIPLTWPLLVPYLVYMLFSNAATDGRMRYRSHRFRRLPIWGFFADYFPARLHKTHDLPPTRKYIFGYHPHGIISHGAFSAFATEALGFSTKFPGIQNSLLTLDSNFRIPLYREYILSLGILSVSKESITNILSTGGCNGEGMGRAVTIVIGGARESLEAQPGTMHLVLGQRKGFIKMAVRTGADLVPVLAFGENDLYEQVSAESHPWLRRAQMYVLRTLKFTLPFLHGRGIFNYDVGLMPYRRPVNIVVGRPIKVTQAKDQAKVDMVEVDRLHTEYVTELQKMWDRYKDEFAANRKEEMVLMN